MQRSFHVEAIWDPEAGVYYAKSDIIGLHIESTTLDEFEELLLALAPDLVVANHMKPQDLANTPLRDLVPAIVWQRPLEPAQ
jgi:hypothetical protein